VVSTATAAFKNTTTLLSAPAHTSRRDIHAFAGVDGSRSPHKPHAPIAAIFEDVGVVLTRKRQSP
jgi:dihydroneopterin aldolase